jgi:hypothetical protein
MASGFEAEQTRGGDRAAPNGLDALDPARYGHDRR